MTLILYLYCMKISFQIINAVCCIKHAKFVLKLMLHVVYKKHLISILNCECDIMSLNNNNAAIFNAATYKTILL